MASKAYVIQKVGYEYNDETYYRPECGGGHAQNVFLMKEEAEKFCQEQNTKALKSLMIGEDRFHEGLRDFAYSPEDLLSQFGQQHLGKFLDAKGLKFNAIVDEPSTVRGLKEFSDEDWEFFSKCLHLSFYEIVEAEIMHVLS